MDSNKKHNVSNIKGKDTSIELILRHALYKEGYRYYKNVKTLPGSPDIVLCKYKIAIFCDGDFFHGYDLTKTESLLKKNKDFWSNKIETNRKRDNKVDEELVSLGYIVLRYWEHEIKHDLDKVINDGGAGSFGADAVHILQLLLGHRQLFSHRVIPAHPRPCCREHQNENAQHHHRRN